MSESGDQFQTYLKAIDDPNGFESYLANVEAAVLHLGFAFYSLSFGREFAGYIASDEIFLFSNYPAEFTKGYHEYGYADYDLGVTEYHNQKEPTFWSDQDAKYLHSNVPGPEKDLIEFAAKHGIEHGVSLPARFQKESRFGMGLVGQQDKGDAGLRALYYEKEDQIRSLFRTLHLACPVGYLVRQDTGLEPNELIMIRGRALEKSTDEILGELENLSKANNGLPPVPAKSTLYKQTSAAYDKLFRNDRRRGPDIKNPPAKFLREVLETYRLLSPNPSYR